MEETPTKRFSLRQKKPRQLEVTPSREVSPPPRKRGRVSKIGQIPESMKAMFAQWKVEDDEQLIEAMEHCADGKKVSQEMIFTQQFTHQEIMERWTAILTDEGTSKSACERLERQRKKRDHTRRQEIPWTPEEDGLLRKMLESPPEEGLWVKESLRHFESILIDHGTIFHYTRTPHTLRSRLEKLTKEDDQKFMHVVRPQVDRTVLIELERKSLKEKREINLLEAEVRHERKTEFSKKALAILRNEKHHHEITASEVLLGRKTPGEGVPVDIDLTGEPYSHKISRQQAVIRLTESLEFQLINLGKQPVFINGEPTPTKTGRVLFDMSLIEIAGAAFIFEINPLLMGKMQKSITSLIN